MSDALSFLLESAPGEGGTQEMAVDSENGWPSSHFLLKVSPPECEFHALSVQFASGVLTSPQKGVHSSCPCARSKVGAKGEFSRSLEKGGCFSS